MRRSRVATVAVFAIVLTVLGASALGAASAAVPSGATSHGLGGTTSAGSTGCVAAGSTGLTAKVISQPFELISGFVNASGCDVGIYVGPSGSPVAIEGATVVDANDHGIFVQDGNSVFIVGNTVENNGLAPHTCAANQTSNCIAEDKAIQLVGTVGAFVSRNTVILNRVDGGIGVADDGPIDPGAPMPGTLRASANNVVMDNQVINDMFGCGIVVASYNAGAGVYGNLVLGNTVKGSSPGTGPFVGGVVVAADTPGAFVWDNVVAFNVIDGSIIPGVVVHSNAPGDRVWNNSIVFNAISNNGFEGPPNDPVVPTGIEVVSEAAPGEPSPPVVQDTIVLGNIISSNSIGVWLCADQGTYVGGTMGNSTAPLGHC